MSQPQQPKAAPTHSHKWVKALYYDGVLVLFCEQCAKIKKVPTR